MIITSYGQGARRTVAAWCARGISRLGRRTRATRCAGTAGDAAERGVANRLQAIREAVSEITANQTGLEPGDPNVGKVQWLNFGVPGWRNGGWNNWRNGGWRNGGWGNGGWRNGGWNNWHNAWRNW